MSGWQLAAELPAAAREAFADLDRVFALDGEWVAEDQMSRVLRVEVAGLRYYVKQYWGAGKGLRRWLGRPRVEAEWQNLRLFAQWGIPAAPVVAWGLERRLGCFARGALITAELAGTADLAALARNHDPRLRQRDWLNRVSRQLAEATRLMHRHGFAHNDLKWRNLLVDQTGNLYLIDCPTGSFWWGPLLDYRIVKDLACLDKVAKYHLSRSRRLRFYLQYRGRERLSANDKRRLRKILAFFEGRE
ncbi:heptose kinase [Pseudomonas sp. A-1]|uniref:lipopolysaccharide kinase InaA family protein n=1 Tax=Pseudomonas sp. A-1 TaxID=1821274 RepID=UPI0010A654AD|nr:lipopolysaccharide kinase InaA family protein [Pseudomonas sp. A-1]THG82536.1 heptose kinase [Pseudomonas sp. A-1]